MGIKTRKGKVISMGLELVSYKSIGSELKKSWKMFVFARSLA